MQELGLYPDHVFVQQKQANDNNIQQVIHCFGESVVMVDSQNQLKAFSQAKRSIQGLQNNTKVVILGPPGSGKTTQCQRIRDAFNLVYINPLQIPYQVVNQVDNVPEPIVEMCVTYVDSDKPPKNFFEKLLEWRLAQQDCVTQGWIMDDFPTTTAHLDFLVSQGLYPDHVFYLFVNNDESSRDPINQIKSRIEGRLIDKDTHRIYHSEYIQPASGVQVVKNPQDSVKDLALRIKSYQDSIEAANGVLAGKLTEVVEISSLHDHDVITQRIAGSIHGEKESNLKIIVTGYGPLGTEHVCRHLHSTTGAVHLTMSNILGWFVSRASDENITRASELGRIAEFNLSSKTNVPDDILAEMVKMRLTEFDCLNKGWILEGFPNTSQQAKVMSRHLIMPNVVVVLKSQQELDDHVVSNRFYDPLKDRVYHDVFKPIIKSKVKNRIIKRPQDDAQHMKQQIALFDHNHQEMIDTFHKGSAIFNVRCDQMPIKIEQDVSYMLNALIRAQGDSGKKSALYMNEYRASKPPLKLIILGPPAGGKGTACEVIKSQFGVVHLSTGDMLRDNIVNMTPLGIKVKPYLDKGALVPDDLIVDMVMDRLTKQDCRVKGWLLDGFPRTGKQAQALVNKEILPDAVLCLTVSNEAIEQRMGGRRTDPVTGITYHMTFNPPPNQQVQDRLVTRSDDTPEKIQIRLDTYYKHAADVMSHFPGMIKHIDANAQATRVGSIVIQTIDKL
ncbi:adenylate kinase [Acrasis kona]|uniref:Adenylate kinase n=1 Tax=Acrasis kona TaxID=1008807 RepID=A0AAW2ZNY3_9EUKA